MDSNRMSLYHNMAETPTVSEVLDIIIGMADNGISRAELARLTGFSKSTISQHAETLLRESLIREGNGISKNRNNSHCLFFSVKSSWKESF